MLQFIQIHVLLLHHHHNASLTWNFPCSYIPYAFRLLSYISSNPLSKLLYLSSNHLCYIYKLSWLSLSLTSQALLMALCSGLQSHCIHLTFINVYYILQ